VLARRAKRMTIIIAQLPPWI